ncbi:hypothetical protein OTU49_013005 [Cherax quadricarinatus]|uniref:Alpha-1,3-mannosyl-glycoprotein 2-beta-N-acetylglucosaminyltransferase n=1 Tax=Cherax quadricarinatus TaxID=27406 RepID=A0AAW0VWW9_CHEQU
MVVVDSHRMKPVNARHFDTYAMDSSEMELFLMREVREGDILIAMTFDEASRNLGVMAKNLLADLGSSQIQNLQFRGQWFMISQRGMKGFSPYETLKASKGGLWSPIDEHMCVPRHLSGRVIMPDPKVMQNDARSKFCEQHSHISDFCSGIMAVAFETAYGLFPGSSYVTVIEEGLLLAPDFMAYSASILPVLHDPTVIAISAWNANGFPNVSSRADLVYRVEDFPGQAFTIRMATYMKELKPNMKQCCNKRGWEGWLELGRWEREMVVPDVSRVLRRPLGSDLEPVTPLIHALFHRLRATNLEMTSPLSNADTLTSDRYESHLLELLNSSHAHVISLTKEDINACALNESTTNLKLVFDDKQSVYVVPYMELDMTGFGGMKILCRCFGLFYDDHSSPRGLHRGLLRFSMEGNEVIFLSNRNQHFAMSPYNTTTLSLP